MKRLSFIAIICFALITLASCGSSHKDSDDSDDSLQRALSNEPTVVNVPSSVSEAKLSPNNILTILVYSQEQKNDTIGLNDTDGKVVISWAHDESNGSPLLTSRTRTHILEKAVAKYNEVYHKNIQLSDAQKAVFADLNTFGVTFDYLPEFLNPDTPAYERDRIQADIRNKHVGIPTVKTDGGEIVFNDSMPTELMIWLRVIPETAKEIRDDMIAYYQGQVDKYKIGPQHDMVQALLNTLTDGRNFYQCLKDGTGLTVKADPSTPYEVMNNVFKNLRAEGLNRFHITTSLKSDSSHSK